MTRWRIVIDRNICVGSSNCIATAPEYFAFDEEDRACTPPGTVPPLPEIIEAAEFCPTSAIDVVDAETGESQLD